MYHKLRVAHQSTPYEQCWRSLVALDIIIKVEQIQCIAMAQLQVISDLEMSMRGGNKTACTCRDYVAKAGEVHVFDDAGR
jgi:hypothetical protein